jgi:hypothetical protein
MKKQKAGNIQVKRAENRVLIRGFSTHTPIIRN